MTRPLHSGRSHGTAHGVLRRLRAAQRDDKGNALVLAIASVLLVALVMGTIFSSVMFSVGNTTATRAQAASRAAAEGGAQQVGRRLLQKSESGSPSCVGLTPPADAWIDYDVDGVWFKDTETSSWAACGSVGIPKRAHAVRVKTTGYSSSAGTDTTGDKGTRGQQGNKRGDVSTVEMTFTRPDQLGLDHAIFGDAGLSTQTNFYVNPDSSGTEQLPVDVVTNEVWKCPSSGVVKGSVYAMGGASIQSACKVEGNFFVGGDLDIGAKLEATGNFYLDGDLLSTSKTLIGGDTLVRGDLALKSTGHKFSGDVRAYGDFSSTNNLPNSLVGGTFYLGGEGDPGDWNTNLTMQNLGTKLRQNVDTSTPEWYLPTIFDTTENPATDEDKADLEFPYLTADDPAFDTFVQGDWGTISAGSRPPSSTECYSWNYTGKVVINEPTLVDVSACDPWEQRNLKLELNADLAIVGENLEKGGDWQITSGNAVGDETRHTLYLISKPTPGQDTCTPGSGHKLQFTNTGWSQKDSDGKTRTKVLMYSAGKVEFSNKNSNPLLGQVYGCEVLMSSGINLEFARGGPEFSDTLWDLRVGSVRDITS